MKVITNFNSLPLTQENPPPQNRAIVERKINVWQWLFQPTSELPADLEEQLIDISLLEYKKPSSQTSTSLATSLFMEIILEQNPTLARKLTEKAVDQELTYAFKSIIHSSTAIYARDYILLNSKVNFLISLANDDIMFFWLFIKNNDVLLKSIEMGNCKIIETIIQCLQKKDPDLLNSLLAEKTFVGYRTLMHKAAEWGQVKVIETLHKLLGAAFFDLLKVKCRSGETLLFDAARHGHLDVVKTVRNAFGENIEGFIILLGIRDVKRKTCLFEAAYQGDANFIITVQEALGEENEDVFRELLKATDSNWDIFLFEAAYQGKKNVIKAAGEALKEDKLAFIELLKIRCGEGEGIFYWLFVERNKDLLDEIQEALGEDYLNEFVDLLYEKNSFDETLLDRAAKTDHVETINLIKEQLNKFKSSSPQKEEYLLKLELFPLLKSIYQNKVKEAEEECHRLLNSESKELLIAIMVKDPTISSYLADSHPEIIRNFLIANKIEEMTLETKLELLPFLPPDVIHATILENSSSLQRLLASHELEIELRAGDYVETLSTTCLEALKQVSDSWLTSINWQDPDSSQQHCEAITSFLNQMPLRLMAVAALGELGGKLIVRYLRLLPPFHLNVVIPQIDKKLLVDTLEELQSDTLSVACLRSATLEQLQEALSQFDDLFPLSSDMQEWQTNYSQRLAKAQDLSCTKEEYEALQQKISAISPTINVESNRRDALLTALTTISPTPPQSIVEAQKAARKIPQEIEKLQSHLIALSKRFIAISLAPEFNCPLSLEVMVTPVLAKDGQNYEMSEILAALEYDNRSPITRAEIEESDLIINLSLQSLIAATKRGTVIPTQEQIQAALKNEPWEVKEEK